MLQLYYLYLLLCLCVFLIFKVYWYLQLLIDGQTNILLFFLSLWLILLSLFKYINLDAWAWIGEKIGMLLTWSRIRCLHLCETCSSLEAAFSLLLLWAVFHNRSISLVIDCVQSFKILVYSLFFNFGLFTKAQSTLWSYAFYYLAPLRQKFLLVKQTEKSWNFF